MNTYSVSGPASGSHSLHFIFFPRKTMRGLERSQLTVATSVLSLCEDIFVPFELLEMVYRCRPARSTTVELTIFAPLFENVSSIEGRSAQRGSLTNIGLKVREVDVLP